VIAKPFDARTGASVGPTAIHLKHVVPLNRFAARRGSTTAEKAIIGKPGKIITA
jgi:hypothetical protein